MIVLDTNVISEAMKPEANSKVRVWLNEQAVDTLYRTRITLAELLFRIAVLPAGKWRNNLTRLRGLGHFEGGRLNGINVLYEKVFTTGGVGRGDHARDGCAELKYIEFGSTDLTLTAERF